MNNQAFNNTLLTGENEMVEFKSSFNDEVITSLVAFANTKGGTVYIGVNDKSEAKGINVGKETIQSWVNEIKNKTTPSIIPSSEIYMYNDRTVVALSVIEYPIKPVSFKGRYFKRIGNANHSMSVTEVADAHLQSINSSWDAYPNTTHTLDDISLEKVQTSIELMNKNGMSIADDPLTLLLKYNLLRDNKLTNAAYLLYKKADSFETTIELGRFQDAITIKDTARSKSDVISQVDQVFDFVKKHLNKRVIITGNPQNTQKWQYPLEAIREIIMNMVHPVRYELII